MVKNWALAIGINQYDFLQPLKYAKRDAQLMQEFFGNQSGFEQVFFFSDDSPDIGGKPTRPSCTNLLRMLQQLFEQPFLEAGDNFWFFFSGHGIIHANHDYLMPADGNPNDVENTAISINYLTECLHRCGAGNIILILDACRYQENKNGEGIGRQTQQIALSTGVISILSCTPHEYSYEIDALQKGAFTHALLEGLGIQGQCATVKRLNQYLSFRVPGLVEQYKNARQTPYTIVEPVTKSHLILIPKYATLDDIATLKKDAFQAEVYKNFELAEQLWIRVNAATCDSDMDAIKAIQRISQLRVGGSQPQTNLTSPPRSLLRTSSLSVLLAQEGLRSTPEIPEIPTEISNFNFNLDCKGNNHIRKFTVRDSDLNSERGIDYKRLRDLLAAQKWKQADRETVALMLEVAGREKEGWLNVESINKFPITDLLVLPKKSFLPCTFLPSEDPEEPGLPDEFHILQPQLLRETFRPPTYACDRVFVGSDLNLYYDSHHPLWYKRPDWFAVVGVSRLYEERELRLSYVTWQEGVNPFAIIELLSPGREKEDLGQTLRTVDQPPTKWQVYEQTLRLPYYIVFDRYTDILRAFILQADRYTELNLEETRIWMPTLELGLGLWQGIYQSTERLWLRWYDANNNWVLTPEEQETQRAEQAEQQLIQERQRAERLAARLRELGINPDEV